MPLGLKPDTELTAQNGKREKLVGHLKQVNLLFFGFTRCPDFCPMTLHRLQSAIGDNTALKAKLSLLFISVDAVNDKPAELARYLASFPYAHGFTGTAEEIRRVEKLFGAYSKTENGSISHSLYLYLLNKEGRVIHLVRYDDPVEKLRQVLEQAAKGEQG
ncbi:MAG: SCO family protein [Spirochaetota bacterium]